MTRLADAIGVEMRSVSGFEKKEFNPSEETIQRIATELRFPLSFFRFIEVSDKFFAFTILKLSWAFADVKMLIMKTIIIYVI